MAYIDVYDEHFGLQQRDDVFLVTSQTSDGQYNISWLHALDPYHKRNCIVSRTPAGRAS